jgi:uncharacterized protein with HEPN domain
MSLSPDRLLDYLGHIKEAIERISHYTDDMEEVEFLKNLLVQDAVIRNLEIIGEASNKIMKNYPDFVTQNADLPLSFAYSMRNALSHGYFKVDFEIVWRTIQTELPRLHSQLSIIIAHRLGN